MLKRPLRVEICGGIASGKTTLALVLAETGCTPNLEDFRSNPFWEAFYKDTKGVAFETELTFFLQHYHEIKKAKPGISQFVCDHSLLLDLAYSRVTLQGKRIAIFQEVFAEVWSELGPPNLLVYLQCDPETELHRIRRRARKVEEAINLSYLSDLNASLEAVVSEYSSGLRVLEIDSAKVNFAELDDAKNTVRKKVLEALPHRVVSRQPQSAPDSRKLK